MKKIFERCIAHVHVIEFQKRGAPHADFLVWVEIFVMSSENVEKTIFTDITSPDNLLYDLVVKMMINGPCGDGMISRLSCVQNGAYKRGFPKPFSDATFVTKNSLPIFEGVLLKMVDSQL